MDFGALPPEVNSGRMYLGPGPAALLDASGAWGRLAAELHSVADGYQLAISGLADASWQGPTSASMAAAITPYLRWMKTTAAQCDAAAKDATTAAAAYEAAFAMTVPPPLIRQNRARLRTLVSVNSLGLHTPAVMATEAEYSEMWAQDASAMYGYAANSSAATSFPAFTAPPRATSPGGLAALLTPGKARPRSAQLSAVPETLHGLATPGPRQVPDIDGAEDLGAAGAVYGAGRSGDAGASASLGAAMPLGSLSVPASWAGALSMDAPEPMLDANVMPGGWGAALSPPSGPPKPAVGGAERDPLGAIARVGFRAFGVSRSPVAG